MSRRTPRFSTVLLLAALCSGLATAPRDTPQTQQPQPTFRTGVTAVPLDVRVLDKDGKPVTDLTAQDFTIVEDGAPQEIAHFSRQILTADAPRPALRAHPGASVFDASPQAERVFLLVLGSAALGDPVRHPQTLDALLRFLRERVLPQDQVALLGNGRSKPDGKCDGEDQVSRDAAVASRPEFHVEVLT